MSDLIQREVEDPENDAVSHERSGSPIDRQIAVVIGVNTYRDTFHCLDNAIHDASAVGEVLRNDYGFRLWPADAPLLDSAAGLDAIRQAVDESLCATTETTRWLFFFAGHGLVGEDKRGYLLPSDARHNDLGSYLDLLWLLQRCQSQDARCSEALIILDACYGGRALVRPEELSDLIPAQGRGDRVRQLITSGNPEQPVLDGGGSGHSVFTRSLLDALEGWAGIHSRDGAVRFTPLLDHLVFEVPGRLRARGRSAALQQPIGGNLVGNRTGRGVVLQPLVPRLDPLIVRDSRSDDPSRRRDSLARLVNVGNEIQPLAVELALLHLRNASDASAGPLVIHTLRYEPVVEVRAQAATMLGALGSRLAVEPLIAALDDDPAVCRAAAAALGSLHEQRAAAPLLKRLRQTSDDLFLDLVGAIGAIGDLVATTEMLRETLRLGRLVPFVGPDFPRTLTGLPNRATIAHELAQRKHLPTRAYLAEACAATMHERYNRHAFTAFLKRALDDQLIEPGEIHRALAGLGAHFWISGAYNSLLPRVLLANTIVSGGDTQYWQPNRPTVVQLAGNLSRPDSLLVLEQDYERLRENEGDRELLVSYLRNELNGKVIVFLGYDPNSLDFALLVRYVLNVHLTRTNVQAFLVWNKDAPTHQWNGRPIQNIYQESVDLIRQLGIPASTTRNCDS